MAHSFLASPVCVAEWNISTLPSPKTLMLVLLGVFAITFAVAFARSISRNPLWQWPGAYYNLVGFVTNFFDTLGIGSYATTTAIYRLKGSVSDEMLPGTLNIGHCIPIIVQAFIYITIVEVDEWTLALMI